VDYIERHIQKAIERGEFETPNLAGKPIEDLDEMKQPGWWAENFAKRELKKDADVRDPVDDMNDVWRRQRR
jgi:hypothetical protein